MNFIKHSIYINLDSRPDRRIHMEQQLNLIGINNCNRFSAIKNDNGAIGCSLSHLKCLHIARQNNWEHVLIMEDDIEFLNPSLLNSHLIQFFESNINFDVLLIAGNNFRPFTKINNYCVKVHNCQTATGYIVQRHYYDTLIHNYEEGIQKLFTNPQNHQIYALDQYRKQLQVKHRWYLIIPLTVIQKEGYSDIEKKQTNYKKIMTDFNK